MYRRILLIVSLGLLTTACAPYYAGQGYYRSDVYSVDRYDYRGYDRGYPYNRGYYVVPPQPRYYAPAPRYYTPAPRYYRAPPVHYRPAPGRYYQDSRDHHGQAQQWRHDRENDHGRNRGRDNNGWGDRSPHR